MIIKIKKRNLVIAGFMLILLVPIIYAAGNIVQSGSFVVELWISNTNPKITFDNSTSMVFVAGVDPTSTGTTIVWFVFNVTDADGENNINETGANFTITLGTPGFRQNRVNTTCTNFSKIGADNMVRFNCSVYMRYFDNSSSNWVLNATALDINRAQAVNDSVRFNYNELSAMSFVRPYINFTSANIGTANQAAANPLILNNTGNDDFDQINITAAALIGTPDSAYTIPSSVFAVNSTNENAGKGLPLSNNVQTIPGPTITANLTLLHGHSSAQTDYSDTVISAKGNQSLYFWVDLDGGGQANLVSQEYNNTWNMTVIDGIQ